MNWVLGDAPGPRGLGLGGRQAAARGDRHGHIYDHFAVEYEYPSGITVFSQCRQIDGCQNIVGESVVGTKGNEQLRRPDRAARAAPAWRFRGPSPAPTSRSTQDLIASILAGNPINEARAIAESTLTGIIGREAAYSGQAITWDEAIKLADEARARRVQVRPYPIPPVADAGTIQVRLTRVLWDMIPIMSVLLEFLIRIYRWDRM